MEKQYIVNNLKETKELAEKVAQKALKSKQVFIIGLQGDLGAGKTTFTQGFAKALGIKEKILSPTFVILKRFKIKNKNFYHIDCYRIKDAKDLMELGFKEIMSDPKNIIVIEWADKVKKIMPKNILWFKIKFIDEFKRSIDISGKL
jgi:tRNA threonylcarbamoyladenosine biosynthesis protein TsaE